MQKTEFSILLTGQYAPQRGTLTLQTQGANIDGFFQFRGKNSYFQGKVLRRNHYVAMVKLEVGGQCEESDVLLVIQKNNVLTGAVIDRWGCWSISGTVTHHESWLSQLQTTEK